MSRKFTVFKFGGNLRQTLSSTYFSLIYVKVRFCQHKIILELQLQLMKRAKFPRKLIKDTKKDVNR